jgi:hypothetical protein
MQQVLVMMPTQILLTSSTGWRLRTRTGISIRLLNKTHKMSVSEKLRALFESKSKANLEAVRLF